MCFGSHKVCSSRLHEHRFLCSCSSQSKQVIKCFLFSIRREWVTFCIRVWPGLSTCKICFDLPEFQNMIQREKRRRTKRSFVFGFGAAAPRWNLNSPAFAELRFRSENYAFAAAAAACALPATVPPGGRGTPHLELVPFYPLRLFPRPHLLRCVGDTCTE